MSAARVARPEERVGDAELLARVAGGDVSAVGTLYDRYADDVRRLFARVGVRGADVDDLTQEAFLDVVRGAKGFDGRESARPWVLGVALNRARRHRRSLAVFWKHLAMWTLEPTESPRSPEDETEAARAAKHAQAALAALSDKKRETFVLVALEGLSGEEAAEALGIPVATVWTRLHHARKELREALEKETP